MFLPLLLSSLLSALPAVGSSPHLPRFTRVQQPATSRFVPPPLVRQSRNFTCGAAALQSVLGFWGEDLREGVLQKLLQSDAAGGTSFLEMKKLALRLNDPTERAHIEATLAADEVELEPVDELHAHRPPPPPYFVRLFGTRSEAPASETVADGCPKRREPSAEVSLEPALDWDGLRAWIDRGVPVLVALQAWAPQPSDYGTRWDAGHYVVVAGYDQQFVYMMDPATLGNYAYLSRDQFMQRWYDVDGFLSEHGQPCPGTAMLQRLAVVIYQERTAPFEFGSFQPLH